jgi:fumarylpyruvate hydrolase
MRLAYKPHRIYCVGRNYADHAREMGADPAREPPFFFSKPVDALTAGDVPYPAKTRDFQHEVELVVALARGGRDLSLADAEHCIDQYAVGIDWTRRDLQAEAKRLGRPWDIAKGFDHSASIGPWSARESVGNLADARIELAVNGLTRQAGLIGSMIWSVPEIIAELSQYYELTAGDLIYTGTPSGVAAVSIGDEITARITGLAPLQLRIIKSVSPP